MYISDKMNTSCFNWHLFSKYRAELMGFATICILLCHARPHGVILPDVLLKIMALGQNGVQIFLFLSGIGIYYSLSSLKQNIGLSAWYKKRFIRLFIPYLLIFTPISIILLLQGKILAIDVLLRLSTLGYWIGGKGVAWFVAALIPFYVISPLLYKLLSLQKFNKVVFLCLYFIPIVIGGVILKGVVDKSIAIAHVVQTLDVFPSFVLGFYIAPYVAQKRTLSYKGLLKLIILLIAVFFLTFYMTGFKSYWLFMLLVIGALCKILELSSKSSFVLVFMGTISLESYLLNVSLPEVYKGTGNVYYLTLVILGILLAFVVSKISKKISRQLNVINGIKRH